MSTATEAGPGAASPQTTVNPLEAVIAATDRQKAVLDQASEVMGVPPDRVLALLRHKWKVSKDQDPFTDWELFLGASMIGRYLLDPITKEVYLGRAKDGRLMIIVGIDGFIKILDRTDHYDGFEQTYEFDEKTGQMVWCETTIYSTKRSHPTVYKGFASEYAQLAGFMYKKIPWHMLRLFSLRHATRLFTPMGAVVTEDEAERMGRASSDQQTPPTTLDDLLDRMEQPAQQQAEQPSNGSAESAEPSEPEVAGAQETPQAEAEEDVNEAMLKTYQDVFKKKTSKISCTNLLEEAQKLHNDGALNACEFDRITAMCKSRQKDIGAGRGAGSNKSK
ncbi:hypothetical protein LCGC14_1291370 [marine sediment metagenome]|uniref:Phage recombination protein Bet n=1 Tax=marine sediment metagenome TaxID=412755 RepID=A0A0F9KTY6_9ZZZZ